MTATEALDLDDLNAFVGAHGQPLDELRVLGIFAHPDDEVFCAGGTFARLAEAGASVHVVCLTHGEAGQIRDARAASRSTLGAVRANELNDAGAALGLSGTRCLDLRDGTLMTLPTADVAAAIRDVIAEMAPDVVVTFGPEGAYGHPDHVVSCLATIEAIRDLPCPPRLMHATFPPRRQMLVDLLVSWLTSSSDRFSGTAEFGHALKLFADGSSMLGFAADHIRVDWFPAGSFLIEQGEPARTLYCLLSGTVDIVVEGEDGIRRVEAQVRAGGFVGEDGLATGQPRNAHVIARDDVTCLLLEARVTDDPTIGLDGLSVDVSECIGRKVAALAAHRSQYAMQPELLPMAVLEPLLGVEHFACVDLTQVDHLITHQPD